jgi:hypothetical protein
MPELLAAMAANRMQTRQSHRTMACLQGVITADVFEAKKRQLLGI